MNKQLKTNLIFTAVILAAAALLFWFTRPGGSGRTAVLSYGDPQVQREIPLDKDADYDVDTGPYTIHLHVEDGGIAFVHSPCPDHTCEGFGVLRNEGDWAACLPARASLIIE